MKKVLLLTVLICACVAGAAEAGTTAAAQKSKKETRKENPERALRKAEAARQDSIAYEIALQAIKDQNFVMEADKVTFKRGQTAYLSSLTNFISLHNGRATVQLAFTQALRSGPNGMGGITVEGHPSGVELKTDKKGNPIFSMNVSGNGISAQITVSMFKGSNKAVVRVVPNFNSNVITLNGYVVPWDDSSVFKGRPL